MADPTGNPMARYPDKRAETSAPVHELIARRWSPRALDSSGEVSREQLVALLEAARWAPSFGNTQPARYIVGKRGEDTFTRILDTLTERNRSWARHAGALLIAAALTRNDKGEIPYADYGVGLASQNLVLQAVDEGLVAHQMAGFDAAAARTDFGIPDYARPLVAIAVGVRGDAEVLADEGAVQRERAARRRHPLDETAFAGAWGTPAF